MHTKHRTQKEVSALKALSNEFSPVLKNLTYREAKAIGIGDKQIYQIRNGEAVDLHVITLLRLCAAKDEEAWSVLNRAIQKSASFIK